MVSGGSVPSGNRPVLSSSVFFPRNHPSPKSSSRSMSSMRSPCVRLSSSGLRAWNASARCTSVCCSSLTNAFVLDLGYRIEGQGYLRTTTRRSPGRQFSVRCLDAMMMAAAGERKRGCYSEQSTAGNYQLRTRETFIMQREVGVAAAQTWRRTEVVKRRMQCPDSGAGKRKHFRWWRVHKRGVWSTGGPRESLFLESDVCFDF